MGGLLDACKSKIQTGVKTKPETINENHLENDYKVYQHQRKFEDAFLQNTEDLIQEITTNSQWQHHETRYLLSQFRKLAKRKDATRLTKQQFTEFLPILLKSFININLKEKNSEFEQNKLYDKWIKNFIKLFSINDEITFQSFANTLSTACRGESNERAKLLFEIFDIDGDNSFNQNELDLFLYYILNINDQSSDDNNNNNSFDINKIIIKSKFIEYIQELISPPTNDDDKTTVTNGQNTTKHTKTDGENDNNNPTDDPPPNDNENENDNNNDNDNDNDNNIDPPMDTPNNGNNSNNSSKSSDKADSDWEKLPLKKEKEAKNENNSDINNDNNIDAFSSEDNDDININIDFLSNMSIIDLKNADNITLLNTLRKLLKDKLFKKNKLKFKNFIQFASKSINFDNLFQSFMIIPTRDDEKKIIKQLMQSTEMTLGASWFVINKEWWDKWCSYTGYNEEQDLETQTDTKTDEKETKENDTSIMDVTNTTKRALRPISISNRELLDDECYFTVLKKSLQENNEFILIPSGAWEQLLEWYGGGPSIQRFVICTNKSIRMKVINYEMDKLKYEYEEWVRINKQAMKKKKNKKKDKEKEKENNNDENNDNDDDDNQNHTNTNGKFNIDVFNKDFMKQLSILSIECHPDTLRIDLHPIYCSFTSFNEKMGIDEHSLREFSISRYATLTELYILICARLGYQIKDIEKEKENYKLYLKYIFDIKTAERANDKDKNKNKKDKKNNNKPLNIELPPKMWTIIQQQRRMVVDRLLYPVPKVDKVAIDKKTETDNSNDNDNDDNDNDKDKQTETETDGDKDTTTIDKDKDKDDDNDSNKNEDDNDICDEDEIDLQSFGLESGVILSIEFASETSSKKTSSKKNKNKLHQNLKYSYNLACSAEDLVCEPEIDDSWLEFETDDTIDGRDRWGKWYEAVIKYHKPCNEPLPKKPKLSKTQEKMEGSELIAMEAIYIHYKAWEEKWDEWIFIPPSKNNIICACKSLCQFDKSKHRLAPPKTQSKYQSERKSNKYSSNQSYHRQSSGGWNQRQRESIRGTPSTAGCVGLVNLGNTCFMNSIIQCVSNTPHLRTFFTSGQYKPDINKSNPLGMKGELAHEFAKLLSDVWSGNYKVIAPRSLKRALSKFAPQFSGWQQHDSQEFLAFLLDGLHEDLNLVRSKPYTEKIESNGRSDLIIADLSWKIYLKRNKSKIVDLFQAQQKSHVICPDCMRNSITFDTYMYLSVPIVGHSTKSLIVDVFHRKTINPINKPIRHVFHVNKYQKVRDLAKMVANVYSTKEQFVLFYENWNMKVAREYEHNLMLGMVSNREALACYILKDWNKIVTPDDIKKKKLSLMLCKICHSCPINENKNSRQSPLFGMPFVISFLNIHTRRQIHQIIYERLFMWIGPDTIAAPPVSGDDKDDVESKWDKIFESSNMPYTLRLQPYKHYSFHSSRSSIPEEIPIDDVIFESKIRTKDIDIIIEWKSNEIYNNIKGIVNKVVVDKEYSEWKKQKQLQSKQNNNGITLYDCINAYVAQETLGDNDLWFCSECKKHEKANKKLDLWSFPEILIIHLKRFQVLGIGRFGRGEKINTFVQCPIRGLDLTQYVITSKNPDDDNDANQSHVTTAPIYDLYAVSCHSGSCGGGHYTAYALNADTHRWYYFNDSSVRMAKESDIISQSSYVLFYKKCH